MLDNQGYAATTDALGKFLIDDARQGTDELLVLSYGYKDWSQAVTIIDGEIENLGTIQVEPVSFESAEVMEYRNAVADMALSESQLEDEEGNTQEVALLSGATDNPFYQASSYTFSTARFRIRGYENNKTETYINSIPFNDAIRFSFNYSMTGGLNQAFRNKTIGMGLEDNLFGFGGIGGANNIKTFAADYAPGTRVSLAYTNGNYRWRGMITHATGLNKHGWAMTVSAVARYAKEGVYPGSFYNSWGYFLALQKVFNPQHTLTLTTFGAPTKRAANSAIYEECAQLVGSNMYSPDWGWQEGKKRNSKVVESFDPTAILNWVWKPNDHTSLNTGFAYHKSFYSKAALNWYRAADPRPDYYRYLPSYFTDETSKQLYTDLWTSESDITQIRWNDLYQANYMNNQMADQTGVEQGSTYILENRHSNQSSFTLSSVLNKRFSHQLTMMTGANANYTVSSYYKTIKDLLGGRYWLDVDNFAERDFAVNQEALQNDLDYYYAHGSAQKVKKGDKYGYDYYAQVRDAGLWANAELTRGNLSGNIGARLGTQASWRDGLWKKGLFPDNSKGKSDKASFVTGGVKANASYSIGGKMRVFANFGWFADAPTFTQSFVSPRTRNTMVDGLKTVKTLTTDLNWQYFSNGYNVKLTGFFSTMKDGSKVMSFYDDLQNAFTNFSMTGIDQRHMGVELAFRVPLPIANLALQGVFAYGNYIYTSTPRMTQTVDNSETVTIKDEPVTYWKSHTDVDGKTVKHFVAGTPQLATSLGLSWNKNYWFVDADVEYFGNSYLDMNPLYRTRYATTGPDGYESPLEVDYMASQEKFPGFFLLNASVGKSWYIHYKYQLGFSLSAKNLLNNTEVRTGGYEQTRLVDNTVGKERYYRFDSKYFYMSGFNYMLNIYFRF